MENTKIQAFLNRYQKERELRYFLLYSLEKSKQEKEIATLISSMPKKIKENKMLNILKKQNNTTFKEMPDSKTQQKILLSLLPREFSDLKDEIQSNKVHPELFFSMFQFLSYHSILQKQNENLQTQIKVFKMTLNSPPPTLNKEENESTTFSPTSSVNTKEQKLRSLIQSRKNDIKYLQKEIENLQRQYDLLKKEEDEKLSKDQNHAKGLFLVIDSKKKDLNELKVKIKEETQENIRLKKQLNYI